MGDANHVHATKGAPEVTMRRRIAIAVGIAIAALTGLLLSPIGAAAMTYN